MLLNVVGLCAQSAYKAPNQSLNGTWKAGQELQAMLDSIIDDKSTNVGFMLAFEGQSTIAILMPIHVTTDDMTMTVDVRIPGTYKRNGQKVTTTFNKKDTEVKATSIESDDPDIKAMIKTEESRKMLLGLVNSMIKEQLTDMLDGVSEITDGFQSFTVKSQTATQLTLTLGEDDVEAIFDRYQKK